VRTGGTATVVKANSVAREHQAHDLQLGKQSVEFGQLGLARAGQVARRDVDDLIGVGEVRDAHVFRIGSDA